MTAITVAMVLMAAFDVSKHGWSAYTLLPWALGGCGMLPLMCPVGIVREKAEGSLRFLAFLPITPAEHATSRFTVAGLLAIPASLVAFLSVRLSVPDATLSLAIGALLGVWALLTVVALLLTALQLRAPLGQGLIFVVYAFVAFLAVTKLVAESAARGWLSGARDVVMTPAGLALTSAGCLLLLAALGWWSFRSIAVTTASYRGERATV